MNNSSLKELKLHLQSTKHRRKHFIGDIVIAIDNTDSSSNLKLNNDRTAVPWPGPTLAPSPKQFITAYFG